MNELAGFTPEQGRLLWQWYLTSRQQQPHIQQNYPQRRPIDEVSPHRVFVLNTEAEVIPPYACMRVTGVDVVGGQTVVKVEKPTDTDGEFLFNCQFEIPVPSESSAGVGWAYRYGVVVMQGNGTPPTEPNAAYVPVVGSWQIEEGSGPFIVFGEHNVGTDTLIGRFAGGGGGGGASIWGTIEEVVCLEEETYCWVTVTNYSGKCGESVPGEITDSYDEHFGMIKVKQVCEIFMAYYTEAQLTGQVIEAGLFYRTVEGVCTPTWLVRQVCGMPECA